MLIRTAFSEGTKLDELFGIAISAVWPVAKTAKLLPRIFVRILAKIPGAAGCCCLLAPARIQTSSPPPGVRPPLGLLAFCVTGTVPLAVEVLAGFLGRVVLAALVGFGCTSLLGATLLCAPHRSLRHLLGI